AVCGRELQSGMIVRIIRRASQSQCARHEELMTNAYLLPRARIGLIIPSSNRLSEPQFQRYAPPDVAVHVTRLGITRPDSLPALEMLPQIEEAASYLADARCNIIVFHCTASSMEA